MIKSIIFDMGNVLLDFNPEVPLDRFCGSDAEKAAIRKELFGGKEWIERDLGNISPEEMYESIAKRIPEEYHEALKSCVWEWDYSMIPIDGAREFLNFVKDKGFGVYILSNASLDFYRYFTRHFDLDFFDGIVVSADIHIIKPDKRIYEHLLSTYKLNGEECLFIDDREDNVLAAKAVGINAYQFKNDYDSIALILAKQEISAQ